MNYIGVSDLKKSKSMWKMLSREKELILTRDGKPGAIILEVTPEEVETTVAAIRRALFSLAVSAARTRAAPALPSEDEIEMQIKAVRRGRP